MSTTLTELIDLVMIESGEFILGDLENTLLDTDKFWKLVVRSLKTYDRYRAYTATRNVSVRSGKFTYMTTHEYGIPDWISSVTPVEVTGAIGIYQFAQREVSERIDEFTLLEIPRGFQWRYDKPALYATENGWMEVIEHYEHSYTTTEDSTGLVEEAALPTLDLGEDKLFIDLLVGKFLQALGRSRRAFTLEELPINMDAAELVTEGTELWNETITKLEEGGASKWWDALGNI